MRKGRKRKLIVVSTIMVVLALLLTLAPSCGNGDDEPQVTPTPGLTPTPEVTPTPGVTPAPEVTATPTSEAKTLRIGVLTYLSGAGAAHGIPHEQGAKWARDVINEAGGVQVGNERYVVEIVSVDMGLTPSRHAEGAAKLVNEEGVHYALTLGGTHDVTLPIFHEGKCFTADMTASPKTITPEFPYSLQVGCLYDMWEKTWYDIALGYDPDVKTVAIINHNTLGGQMAMEASRMAAESHGLTVISEFYELGTVDFYALLVKILAKNPDVIEMSGSLPGSVALVVKQACELGYEGKYWAPSICPLHFLLTIAKPECVNDRLMSGEPNFTSDVFPQATRDLYLDYLQRYHPEGDVMGLEATIGYDSVMLFVRAIEEAGSVDVDEVMKVFDDPGFRFDWFGAPSELGGYETFGIRRAVSNYQAYSEIRDSSVVTKANTYVPLP